MSRHSLKSDLVSYELEHAAKHKKTIITFKIDETMPDDKVGQYINSKHWIDASSKTREQYDELIKQVLVFCRKDSEIIYWSLNNYYPESIVLKRKDYPSIILVFTPVYWASFIYMGIVAGDNFWRAMGFVYMVPSIVHLIIFFHILGPLYELFQPFLLFTIIFLIIWVLAIVHMMIIRKRFLAMKHFITTRNMAVLSDRKDDELFDIFMEEYFYS